MVELKIMKNKYSQHSEILTKFLIQLFNSCMYSATVFNEMRRNFYHFTILSFCWKKQSC